MSVLLKKPVFDGVSPQELAEQIQAKKKSEKKLPTWFDTPKIYFPAKLNIEQTSSEITARYKTRIVDGKTLFDMTGGFGVDSYFFSTKVDEILHCEIDKGLSEIASHNFKMLGAGNVRTVAENGLVFLEQNPSVFDWIYTDPSRRHDIKGKVFQLMDCSPDIPSHLELLFKKTDNIMIKTSPFLDVTMGMKELQCVKEIHIVAIQNEVKELLWILKKGFKESIAIKTINFKKLHNEVFDFRLSEEKNARSTYGAPQKYVYEPNAAILKSGAFTLIGSRLGIRKLHQHTHLYTSDTLIDFPGRRFEIQQLFPYTKKTLRQSGLKKANITVRNFKESVADIRKKFKIKDGGDTYLFFTKNNDDKFIVIQCLKISN